MNSLKTNTKHALITILSFIVLSSLIYVSGFLSQSIVISRYLPYELLSPEVVSLIQIFLITISVLLSYILYLILSAKTRAELAANIMTKSLYASLNQLNEIYEDSPVPYITLNSKGEILDPNKATLRFFGVSPNEIEEKNLFKFVPDDEREKAEKLLDYYRSKVAINREELRMITKDGRVRWVLLSVFRMEGRGKGGRVGLATIFDITEQKELDKAKTEFVSLASHQLRSPSATIKWYADMLLAGDLGELNEKQNDYLVRIRKSNENMIELIETLLNISRLEIGTLQADKKDVDLQEIVESVLQELAVDIQKKGISIVKDYRSHMKTQTDPKFLRIAIQNLVSNAIKYTNEGGTVKVSINDEGSRKSLSVIDNGIGIPEEDQDKIFSKMFRAENARKNSNAQGTGLGLYLVKSMMEALGGSIDFVSEEDKGSAFTIRI